MQKDPNEYRHWVSAFRLTKVSVDDCLLITGADRQDIPEFLGQVLSWGPELVLLTKGAEGTDAYTAAGVLSIPAIPCPRVLDTTGAGDCFMAGFLLRYSQTNDIPDAVRFGSAAVSQYIIQRSGGGQQAPDA